MCPLWNKNWFTYQYVMHMASIVTCHYVMQLMRMSTTVTSQYVMHTTSTGICKYVMHMTGTVPHISVLCV